jgi:hypothetical protein
MLTGDHASHTRGRVPPSSGVMYGKLCVATVVCCASFASVDNLRSMESLEQYQRKVGTHGL